MKSQAERISTPYLDLQRELHQRPEGYGGKGKRWVDTVLAICRHFDAWSVLDYGCGQGTLAQALRDQRVSGLRIDEYDPAVKGKSSPPAFADVVTCTDVLEHIEPDRLDAVLAHLQMLTRKAALLVISLEPANKVLADGRNAHLIVKPAAWWQQRVEAAGFAVQPWDPDWPIPRKVLPATVNTKHWIAVVTPC